MSNIDMMFIEKERIGGIGTFHIRIHNPSVMYQHGFLRFQAQTFSVHQNQTFIRTGTFTQSHWDAGGAHLGFPQKQIEEIKREMRR